MKKSSPKSIACWLCLAAGLFPALSVNAQEDAKEAPWKMEAYGELYYSYDFNKPSNHQRPAFLYHFNRHNEVNLNLGYLKGAYAGDRVRAALAMAAGTYINANYDPASGVLQHVYEAYGGVKLSDKSNLWLDAGIFSSHIGFESAVGMDNWALSRSLCAESTPYYKAGVKLGYNSPDNKWFLSGLYLNGWQRIVRPEGNNTPAFGTQVTFTPSGSLTFNSSTFIGNDKPDSVRQMRYFHHFFGQWKISDRWGLLLGLDAGMEQQEKGSSEMNTWFNPTLLARCQLSKKWGIAGRIEYYQDKEGVIIATGTPNGFQTWGFSSNLDLQITSRAVWRTECRIFSSKDMIFEKGTQMVTGNTALTTSLAFKFN